VTDRFLVELLDRIHDLEANSKPSPNPGQIRSLQAQPTGLVESVRHAIDSTSVVQEPRAAIRAVAAWLRYTRFPWAADHIEKELTR
jgi:hypothetical protein